MFMLYAVAAGLLIGLVAGGRLDALAELRIRWAPLALLALLTQVALFSPPVAAIVGDLGPMFYVGSTAVVLIVVMRNARLTGLPVVAAGATANLVAILANGGYMPASPAALAAIGASVGSDYSNSAVLAAPALPSLTDVFAMPAWLPFANIFSAGDMLIGIGVAIAIVAQMRLPRPEPAIETEPVRSGTSLQGAGVPVPRGH